MTRVNANHLGASKQENHHTQPSMGHLFLPKRDLVRAICTRSTCALMDRLPLTLQAEQAPEKRQQLNNHRDT